MTGRRLALGEVARHIGAELRGDAALQIARLNTLKDAGPEDLAFLANPAYRGQLAGTGAAAVILTAADADGFAGAVLIAGNPYLAYARATALFDDAPRPVPGVHPSAVVDPTARIDAAAAIGAQVVVGPGAVVGADTWIGPGTSIGAEARIGARCRIAANVSIYHRVRIGEDVVIHSGAVLGADGFGFAHDGRRWVKIHQLGGLVVGDRVEIGACTTIDRGALGDTVIEAGVILDNHVQIGHNVRLGENTAMAAYAGIAGSATIGRNCIFAGQAGAVGHVTICDNVVATARCTLSKDIARPGSYSADLLMEETPRWRRNAARFRQLDDMARRLKKLEGKLERES
ncbi:MAG: UDP-3-O-acylglucosamine N-acyltransferase [Porticoccaceae bacterium]